MNVLKIITFNRMGPFEIKATYADDQLGDAPSKELGTYIIEMPPVEMPKKVKVKVALTVHGTFVVQGAHIVEGELDAAPAVEENGEAPRKRRKVKRAEVAVKRIGCPGLHPAALMKGKEFEVKMIEDTKEIVETNARKNDLEAYILTMRSAVAEEGKLAPYMTPEYRASLQEKFTFAEDWLYDHLDDSKEVFVAKLAELRALAGLAEARHQDDTQRPELISRLEETITALKAFAKSGAGGNIMENAKLQSLEAAAGETQHWLAAMKDKQASLSKLDDAVLSACSLEGKAEELLKLKESVMGSAPKEAQRTSIAVD